MVHGPNGTNSDFVGEYLTSKGVEGEDAELLSLYADWADGEVGLVSRSDDLASADSVEVDGEVYSIPGEVEDAVSYVEEETDFERGLVADGGPLAPGEVRSDRGKQILYELGVNGSQE